MITNPLELAMPASPVLTGADIVLSLLLALVLGLVVAMVYRVSVPGRLMSPTLQASLVLLAMTTSMVMMVIGNNLARAFSLVGALAIVRFRTRLRSTWDISFVFFALAAGIGSGVQAHNIAILGTLVISLTVLAMYVIPLSGVRGEVQLLRCDLAAYQGHEVEVAKVVDSVAQRRWLIEARSMRFGETLSVRYRVVLRPKTDIEALLRQLSDLEGVERVMLYAEEDGLGRDDS